MSAGHRCSPRFLPQFRPELAKNIKSRVLILHGAEDEVAPLTEVNKLISDLRAVKVAWELQLFSGAQHAFTNPSNASEERADREYKFAIERFFKGDLRPIIVNLYFSNST